jgi:lipopolysaccharide transport system ATP-binding protein
LQSRAEARARMNWLVTLPEPEGANTHASVRPTESMTIAMPLPEAHVAGCGRETCQPPISSEIAIAVSGVGKRYQLYEKPHHRLKQSLLPPLQRLLGRAAGRYYDDFVALEDVSFQVARGETVGIIGRNGSGKSTLLQIICGVLNPSSGSVSVNGRVAALLELGAGFNMEFTGAENVRLSCALLGLSGAETDARFEQIAAFAGIGEFMDQPVKTYSSGMFVRLAFAVNIVCKPDIMIVDEALSVGDMNFQAKCMTALKRLQESGATVLFVSHDIGAVRSLCTRAVYLDAGRLRMLGGAADVASAYVQTMREEMNAGEAVTVAPQASPAKLPQMPAQPQGPAFRESAEFDQRVSSFRYGKGGARIAFAELLNDQGQPVTAAEFGQKVIVRIYVESQVESELTCNYYVTDSKKNFVIGCDPRLAGDEFIQAKPGGRYVLSYTTTLPLKIGHYSIDLELARPVIVDEKGDFLDVVENAVVFHMLRRPRAQLWAQVYVDNTYECIEV